MNRLQNQHRPERAARTRLFTHYLRSLIDRRAEMVRRSVDLRRSEPRNRAARHTVFDEIRHLTRPFWPGDPESLPPSRKNWPRRSMGCVSGRSRRRREYFFGLFNRMRLEGLSDAPPAICDFRV